MYSFRYRNDLGTLIQYLIFIFNKVEKIVTCNPATFTVDGNKLTLEIKNLYRKANNERTCFRKNDSD